METESLRRAQSRRAKPAIRTHYAESIAQIHSRLTRTLLGTAIGALLAMVFVPCTRHGYEPIFNTANYQINVAQLLLNISFAALVGALAAEVRLKGERGFGCLPCLFTKGDRWLKIQRTVAMRINI